MPKCISVSDEVYKRLNPLTNKLGGRNKNKIGFSEVINRALDDQERFENRIIRRKVIE